MKWMMLDFGGVIADDHCDQAEIELASIFEVSREKICSATTETGEIGRDIRLDKISEIEFWCAIGESVTNSRSIPSEASKLTKLWAETYSVRPYMIALIKEIQSRGYHIGVATNCDRYRERHMQQALERASLSNFSIFPSWRIGHMKPDSNFFEGIEAQIDISRVDTIIFSDDRQKHIEAASNCGWDTIKFESFDQFQKSVYNLTLNEK